MAVAKDDTPYIMAWSLLATGSMHQWPPKKPPGTGKIGLDVGGQEGEEQGGDRNRKGWIKAA